MKFGKSSWLSRDILYSALDIYFMVLILIAGASAWWTILVRQSDPSTNWCIWSVQDFGLFESMQFAFWARIFISWSHKEYGLWYNEEHYPGVWVLLRLAKLNIGQRYSETINGYRIIFICISQVSTHYFYTEVISLMAKWV